ncbi:receptor-like protein 35 [Gossypium hirsutum]|uniref:Receptor-like protein 35 n=1 Tax=Gossypium hirsutum TaxID=3635 RepID=A0ABM3AJY6_GOSHI|nr:receptor-like protein 35 [Gossypium hirsutum]
MGSLCLVLVVLLLSWTLSSSGPPPSSHLCLPHQRDALFHFKTTISVDCDHYGRYGDYSYPRIDIESWKKSLDCCSWEGIKCDNITGHVIDIDLSHSCLLLVQEAITGCFMSCLYSKPRALVKKQTRKPKIENEAS